MVSVIVTSYNQESTISQTLNSILAQKCNFPYEIIIGDDCSSDGTQNICIDFFNRNKDIIRLIFRPKNLGVTANWLLCIKEAKGEYITSCAADDYWSLSTKLQLQVDLMVTNHEIGLCYTDFDIINKGRIRNKMQKGYLKRIKYPGFEGNNLVKEIFEGKLIIAMNTVCFRRDLFERYIPFEDFIRLEFPLEDWPTWLILSKYCMFKYIPLSTAVYRKGHESNSNPTNYENIIKKYKAEKIMYKYLCDYFPEDLPYCEIGFDSTVNSILLNLAYKKFDFFSAKKYALPLLKVGLRNPKVIMARNWIAFNSYATLKYIRNKFFI